MAVSWWAGLFLLAACGWETFWRRKGFIPWVRDDWPAWALARRCLRLTGRDAVAVLGASRVQVALDPDILTTLTGQRPVMLAIDGASPLAVLADLAADAGFNGTVICSLMPAWLAEPAGNADRAAKWIRKSHRLSIGARRRIGFWIACQARLACLSPDLTPARLFSALKAGAWPLPHRAPMTADRFRRLDYRRADIDRLRHSLEQREKARAAAAHPLTDLFEQRLEQIESSVQAIHGRGGQVIFLRLPSSGAVRALEARTWPRSRYWDRLSAATCARTIHFADYPQLANFECADGSHLGAEDRRRFTAALVEILGGKEIENRK